MDFDFDKVKEVCAVLDGRFIELGFPSTCYYCQRPKSNIKMFVEETSKFYMKIWMCVECIKKISS